MQLVIHGLDAPRTAALRHRADERFTRALGPIPRHVITHLAVWVDDINGPRGGVDKRCRVRAESTSGSSITVRAVDRIAERAVDRAARRLRTILDNKLKRQRTARRRLPRTHRARR